MYIERKTNNDELTLKVIGSVVERNDIEAFSKAMQEILDDDFSPPRIILNLKQCPIVASLVLGKVLVFSGRILDRGGFFSIRGLHNNLENICESVQLGKVVLIEDVE